MIIDTEKLWKEVSDWADKKTENFEKLSIGTLQYWENWEIEQEELIAQIEYLWETFVENKEK